MPTQPTPQPSIPRPARKASESPAEVTPPDPATTNPKPDEGGAVFRAFLDAGADAVVAYTAEKRVHTMVSEIIQPFRAEVFRRLDALATAGAERDRRLDVIVARLDGLKVLGQVMVGAFALLITVLIAVFGLLFTN